MCEGMSLGRRIVQRATTRAFRRGIRVIVRKPDETDKPTVGEPKTRDSVDHIEAVVAP